MLNCSLIDAGTGEALYIVDSNGDKVLITHTHAQAFGRFKAKSLSAPGTVIVGEPDADGCISLTDLILTSDKTQSTTVTVQFTDGTHTIVIMEADITDAPINLAISFNGQWKGWKNARLELVVTGGVNPAVTLACGYVKMTECMLYNEWDALR